MLSDQYFVLFDKRPTHCSSVPVKGYRVAVHDDKVRFAKDIESSPLTIEEIEIEFPLVVDSKPTPSLTHTNVNLKLSFGIN